ncbi:ead/Ea22-like family protein [Escherichia coli]|nr:ead/Ea22-like family protein [Escherichia coli]
MSNIDKRALREAAEKAISEEGETWWNEDQLASDYGLALHRTDAKFIAAANPATVLALLDELEAAEKRIDEQREIMRQAASDISYAIFNLTGSDLSRLQPGVVETTDPTDTALIAERSLRAAAAGKGE